MTAIDSLRSSAVANFARFGVDGTLLAAAYIRRVTHDQARNELGIQYRSDHLEGLWFPAIHPENGSERGGRLRRDHPERDSGGAPIAKYLSPPGRHSLFFPPGASGLLVEPSSSVVLVEAEKSALTLTAAATRTGRRLLAIAVGGCWGWKGTIGKTIDSDGARVDEKGPLPDLDWIVWTDRDAIVLFDSNAATNPNVQTARRALAQQLVGRGAVVRIATLPVEPHVNGPDDYWAAHGDAAVFALLDGATPFTPSIHRREVWPSPLRPIAFQGVFGAIVRALAPESEADPAALLIQQLVFFGSLIGRTAHFRVEADTHYLNLYAVLVGRTAKGRKGVSTGQARRVYDPIDHTWTTTRQTSGLSSGEGLIWAVRDPIEKQSPIRKAGRVIDYQTVKEDHGIEDKRLLVVEAEFAGTLRALTREGNTLSAVMRQAWDGLPLRALTKNSPAHATGAHISIIGHITRDELRRYLDATEAANGFGNRILFLCVQRSQLLPEGGRLVAFDDLQRRLEEAVAHARTVTTMRRDEDARALWHAVYESLSAGRPGLLGSMTARAEALTMRLACLFALGDGSAVIRRPHLEAALEVWRYAFASAQYIFGGSLGDPTADAIVQALQAAPEGLTRSAILHDVFNRNRSSEDIHRALGVLEEAALARRIVESNIGGRPAERWVLLPQAHDINDITPTYVVNVVAPPANRTVETV
jgi:Domain of unknown function (DUF3854)